jgi:predicted lysophospholipase L1 biosynthesis ABC-type transport system permease subunit
VLCVALIAAATFLIVSVDSFRREGGSSEGGYRYFAESAIPIYNAPETLDGVPKARWLAFRLRPGDDASCLNLYAPQNPRVIGAPPSYLELPEGTAAVDANTLTYVLHKKAGDTIEIGGATFRIERLLHDSVFQSEVLISDADFRRAYPEEGGFRVFLIDAPAGADAEFESALADYGLDLTTTAERRAAYHRVENTYLSTFQSLGALGLLLGTVGLAAVLMRNLLERRREFAVLRAVGFQPAHLASMTLAEAVFLLVAGLAIGTAAALVAVLPTVLARGGSPPIASLLLLLAAVLVTGLLVSFAAVRLIVRAPLLDALRSE